MGRCPDEIAPGAIVKLGILASTLSHHLHRLREVGLVASVRESQCFELDNPPLKLALNEVKQSSVSHLGVQGGESDTDCCLAIQDKVWVADPDGHRWEVFVVKGDAPQAGGCGCGCSA